MKYTTIFCLFLSVLCVFNKGLSQPIQIGQDIDGTSHGENSGYRVALNQDATRMVTTAPFADTNGFDAGYVKVFQLNGDQWEQLGATLIGEAQSNLFGVDMELNSDGTILAVAAPQNEGNGFEGGNVRVFQFDGTNWVPLGNTINGDDNEHLGVSLSLSDDGTKLVIGAQDNNVGGFMAGAIKAYAYNGTDWVQRGSTLYGLQPLDKVGSVIAASNDGNIIAYRGNYSSGANELLGEIRVFQFDGTDWVPLGNPIEGREEGEGFGEALAINGDGTVLGITAPYNKINNTIFDGGRIYNYKYNGSQWVQKGPVINGEENGHRLGITIALDDVGDRLAVGAMYFLGQSGQVRIYDFMNGAWMKKEPYINGESANDFSSWWIHLNPDGTRIAIGAPGNDQGGNESGHARVYNIETFLNTPHQETPLALEIVPNPADTHVRISTNSDGPVRIKIYSVLGQLVYASDLYKNASLFDVSTFSRGVYVIHLQSDTQQVQKKLILE